MVTAALLEKPLEISEIKTDNAVRVRDIQQSVKRRIANARKTPEKYSVAKLEELSAEIDALVKEQRHALDHGAVKLGMNGRQLLAQLADLETSLVQITDFDEKRALKEMKKDLDLILNPVLDRELLNWFTSEMTRFKSELAPIQAAVAAAESAAQKDSDDMQLRRQIAILKHYDDVTMLKGDVMKRVELCASVPKATRDILFHPVWLARKLEREFTAVVDKSRDTHSKSDGCFVAGTARDVDACIARLETADYVSGKKNLLLDGRTLATVMGVGGANAYDIERECGVILYAATGSVELTIFGTEKSVAKALQKIGDVKQITSTGDNVQLTSDRLVCNAAVARAFQNLASGVEEECGVSVSVTPSADNPREATVVVRGQPESVAAGMHALHAVVKRMNFETVECDNAAGLDRLFNPPAVKRGIAEARLAARFSDLKKRAVMLRVDNTASVDIVTLEEMEGIQTEFFEILKRAVFETEKVELDHTRIWSDEMCKLVASLAGDVEIAHRRSDESNYSLELWGSPSALANTHRLIAEVMRSTSLAVPEEAIRPMLDNKCQVLQSLQTDCVVSAHYSKFENQLIIYGLDKNKKHAVSVYNAFLKSVKDALLQSTIKTIPIASDEIGRLIGPKGRVMNGIKEKADLDEIRISEAEMKVYITGSNSSIDYAVSLIEEELSARKDATVVQIGLGESSETAALLAGASETKPVKTNEWVSQKEEKAQEIAPMESQELFPSLGAATSQKPKRWR